MSRTATAPLDAIPAEDVAAALGLTRQTVLRMARRGELPRVQIGSRVVFRRSSIEAHLKRKESPALV